MAIEIVALDEGPDDWPIRYIVRLRSDVSKKELSKWAADLTSTMVVEIESEAVHLSRAEISDVVAPHVESVKIRITSHDA